MSTKILFLNPPFKTEHGKFSRTSRSPAVTKSGTVYYPIWLAYAAGSAEKAGNEIMLIDACSDLLNYNEVIQSMRDFVPDLVVLDTSTPSIISDIDVAGKLKVTFPGVITALMGTHPSVLDEETLSMGGGKVDLIIRGEADETIVELARSILPTHEFFSEKMYEKLNEVLGISFRRQSGEIKKNEARPLIADLDSLPFVSEVYHKHLKVKNYFFAACDYPEVQIMSARGCTHKCTFCVYPHAIHNLKYRVRSAKNLADEFDWIAKNMPSVKEVGIEDDTFAGNIKRVHEFCQEKIARGNTLKWYTNVRATLKLETLELMKKANCVLLTVGYESANQNVLGNMKKLMDASAIKNFSRDTKKAGIMVHSCFMVGNRGDTRETLKESLDLALQLNDDTMQFFPLIVYPGTPDYQWAKENNLIEVDGYSEWVTEDGMHNSVIRMPDMTCREIVDWCDYARRRYYLRPKYLFHKLTQTIFKPSEFYRNLKAAKRFFRFLLLGTFGSTSKPIKSV
jgi:radical SAM superfamily enzyme YgiQ (UPF0313 family)